MSLALHLESWAAVQRPHYIYDLSKRKRKSEPLACLCTPWLNDCEMKAMPRMTKKEQQPTTPAALRCLAKNEV